jgi:hypothetical protein
LAHGNDGHGKSFEGCCKWRFGNRCRELSPAHDRDGATKSGGAVM